MSSVRVRVVASCGSALWCGFICSNVAMTICVLFVAVVVGKRRDESKMIKETSFQCVLSSTWPGKRQWNFFRV